VRPKLQNCPMAQRYLHTHLVCWRRHQAHCSLHFLLYDATTTTTIASATCLNLTFHLYWNGCSLGTPWSVTVTAAAATAANVTNAGLVICATPGRESSWTDQGCPS
jgi:hypothetical protein